jgi:hypothetical protein
VAVSEIPPILVGVLVWAGGVVMLSTVHIAFKGKPDGDALGLIFFWPAGAAGIVLLSPFLPGLALGLALRWLYRKARDSFESAKLTTGEFNEP